ncbi:MAG: hypothetical protein HY567_04450 [Candidatus Kerfeldbacteria bacterium]|nr:hypothetical protein [Candidatus Kerfeldbacteria bacterium]
MNGDQGETRQPLRQTLIFRILAVVVVLAIIVVLALFLRRRAPSGTNVNTSSTNRSPVPVNLDTRQGITREDGDQDGLTNDEEVRLGTNPTQADSDRDEISDFDEVKLYQSDPNKADSDGDGHSDGEEVRQRFSPTGPGKLFETVPPAATPS